jgi:hypothetical protein
MICENRAGTFFGGGGVCCSFSSPVLINNTLTLNEARIRGGGLICVGSSPIVSNSVFWNNNAPEGRNVWLGTVDYPSELTISYSDVEGGYTDVHVEYGSGVDWGPGMIDADPLFVDPTKVDYHLTFSSPCRGSGNNNVITEPTDFEGDPRIAHGTVDMGADEFYTHLYQTGDATPGGLVEIKFVALPDTAPVALCIGTGVLDHSIPTHWGAWWKEWWLEFPIIGPVVLGSIPSPDGIFIYPARIPPDIPGPYAVPMQAFIGDSLTNLYTMEVE